MTETSPPSPGPADPDAGAAPDRRCRVAVIGAGPVGLALALLAARQWPQADVTVFDARAVGHDVSGDPRALALAQGSVQLLQGLGVWPQERVQAIRAVQVTQAPPTLELPAQGPFGLPLPRPEVRIQADALGVPQLGAVLHYGALVAPLQQAWADLCAAQPAHHRLALGHPVTALEDTAEGVTVRWDTGTADFDLAVVAEGGVFAGQARKALHHDYRQNAWVGTVELTDTPDTAPEAAGCAFEHFTRDGPVALLPLPRRPEDAAGRRRASLVWCVPADGDPVAALEPAQRLAVLATRLPTGAGALAALGPLKCFPLGLNAEARLVRGRTVRIGNAAQTLHPVAGQGLNLGLRDAQALVHTLRQAAQAPGGLHTPGQLDAALRRVAWARSPDRWGLIATTDFLARSFTWPWPGLAALRGLGLAAVQSLPPLKAALARHMMFGRR